VNSISKYSLSNGTFCQVLDIFNDFNLVKITLPSKNIKILSSWYFVISGRNSKQDYKFNRLGKAGINYLTGKKPSVRGVAKNPVDHPHGGRTKTNQPEVSP
jgi:large subunit ribosomal protein L2